MPFTTYGLLKAIRSHQINSPSVQGSLETGWPNGCNQCHQDRTLAWTADYLSRWYDVPRPKLSAAGVGAADGGECAVAGRFLPGRHLRV
jgi:hypothetical protein